MCEKIDDSGDDLEQYRRYMRFLARTHLSGRYQNRIDASDIVQQALLRAHERRDQYRGTTKVEKLGWLRKILVRTIKHAVRNLHAQCRDVKREIQILRDIEHSSIRLSRFLVSRTPEPSKQASDQETLVAIANAIESLSEQQRQVILLKYWQHCTLKEIAQQLQTTVPAVVGLNYRARRELKRLLSE